MKHGVSAHARNEKRQEVKRYVGKRNLVFHVLSIVAPGAGQLAEGRPIVGTLFLLTWSWGVVQWLLGSALYRLPDVILGAGARFSFFPLVAMLVVFILANFTSRTEIQG